MLMTLLCLKNTHTHKTLHCFHLQMLNLDLDFLFLTFVFLTRCYLVSYVMWMILVENTFKKVSLWTGKHFIHSFFFFKSGNGVTIKLSEHFPLSTIFSIYFKRGIFLKLNCTILCLYGKNIQMKTFSWCSRI